MAAQRYKISLGVLKTISQVSTANKWNSFSTLEEKFCISKQPCNDLFIFYLHLSDPTDTGPSLLIHSSKSFSLKHWDTDQEAVKSLLISHARELIPDLPHHIDSRCLRWRYSQVVRGFEGAPGCLILSSSPLLIACGDAFTHTNFDGCVSSAQSVAKTFSLWNKEFQPYKPYLYTLFSIHFVAIIIYYVEN